MGTISEQLSALNEELKNAKKSINNKYNTMGMPSIDKLKIRELSTKIDDIPVLNTNDATAIASDIMKDKTAYGSHQKIVGTIEDLSSSSVDLDMTSPDNLEFKTKATGYISSNTKFKVNTSLFAQKIGLVSSVIQKGKTILGIQGNYVGLDITKDATAKDSDIVKNKTAYVNEQKVTGSLQDYTGTTVNTIAKLKNKSIAITLPTKAVYDELSSITINLSEIATLIGLTSDKIKEGEEVLGVIGSYSKPPEGDYVDYETTNKFFNFPFKWGYWELSSGNYSGSVQKLYKRLYNAYYYNGECDGYYVDDDKNTIYAPTYDHKNLGHSLSCYVYDLNITPEECNEVWRKVWYDCPELMIKFGGYYYSTKNGYVNFMFLATFDVATRNDYKNTCLNTFKEISNIVKNTYGITYKGDLSDYDSFLYTEAYTPQEKFKIAKVIHDFLVLNNSYGYSSIEHLDQIMYPALSKGKYTPVCASYSKSFQWCCQKYGIYNLPVVGYAGENHLWNMVCYERYDNSVINGHNNPAVWNEVDVTWDDPTNGDPTVCRWDYFNVTTSYMSSNAGGNRTRSIWGSTSNNNEAYRKYISSTCTCTTYKYNGSTNYGGL